MLPFDFRQALINSLIGTIMALSLVVVTGFVGQISVVQLCLAGVAGFTVSHMAVDAGSTFLSHSVWTELTRFELRMKNVTFPTDRL